MVADTAKTTGRPVRVSDNLQFWQHLLHVILNDAAAIRFPLQLLQAVQGIMLSVLAAKCTTSVPVARDTASASVALHPRLSSETITIIHILSTIDILLDGPQIPI